MPIYEFSCNACGARVSLFFRSMNVASANGTCDKCGSTELTRLISRFNLGRPPIDPTSFNKQEMLDGVDYTNPASMAQFFKKMQSEFRDEQNDYMDDIIGRLDHGEAVQDALGLDMGHEGHDHGDGGGDRSEA